MAIEIKELVVRFTVNNQKDESLSFLNQFNDEKKIKEIVSSMIEEYFEKKNRKVER